MNGESNFPLPLRKAFIVMQGVILPTLIKKTQVEIFLIVLNTEWYEDFPLRRPKHATNHFPLFFIRLAKF